MLTSRNSIAGCAVEYLAGGEPIAEGPGLESQLAELVRTLLNTAAAHHDMTLASTESDARV
jgi:hypothetical protein